MATNTHSLRTLHHHHSHSLLLRRRPHSLHSLRPPPNSSSLHLNPTNSIHNASSSSSLFFSSFPVTSSSSSSSWSSYSPSSAAASTVAPSSTSTTQPPISFDLLEQHLTAQNFRQADEETRRLLIALAGEAAVKRGYVFFSEVQYIQESDLKAIDSLWTKHSDNKFGYSVQKRLWEKCNRDFTKLFIKLGWMKKLDTELEQYNYKSFPTEFFWELNQEDEQTPEGHLPLTNALRGTQLFQNILLHPAFDDGPAHDKQQGRGREEEGKEEEAEEEGKGEEEEESSAAGKGSNVPNFLKRIFKPNYRF